MNTTKEELQKLILEENLSYREIGRRFNVSDTYIKRKALELGLSLPVRKIFPEGFKPKGNSVNRKERKSCLNCGKETPAKYCSQVCFGEHKKKENYKLFLEKNDEYCRASYNPRQMKPFILEEQDHKCAICNTSNEWNGQDLVFVLDHIDGDASNNKRGNLRLVCPNCDSQLPTFKSRNKNSARKQRYLLNYKNL